MTVPTACARFAQAGEIFLMPSVTLRQKFLDLVQISDYPKGTNFHYISDKNVHFHIHTYFTDLENFFTGATFGAEKKIDQ